MPSSRISALCRAALVSGLVSAGLVPLAHAARYHRLTDSPNGTYRVDPNHSLAWFTIGHAGVAVVVGRFDKMSGTYTFDSAAPSRDTVAIRIAASSIDTDFPMRDHDLRGPGFLQCPGVPDHHL